MDKRTNKFKSGTKSGNDPGHSAYVTFVNEPLIKNPIESPARRAICEECGKNLFENERSSSGSRERPRTQITSPKRTSFDRVRMS